jgi:glycosyltransferase involved in cell wall biosynthesis
VDLDVFAPRGRDDSRRLLGLNGRHILLYVGRPDGIKGLDLLLRSVAEIAPAADRGLKLVVVGDLDGEGSGPRGHYRRLAHHLGLEEIVEFRGIVPQHQLPLYYSAADLCAVPSTYESFGLVAVESMACQTPVVAFAVGGLADTITDEDTGFLAPPGNRAAFSRQLSRALESKRLKEMGRRGRLSVRQYAWSNVVSRTLALYERVLEESRFFYRASCGS